MRDGNTPINPKWLDRIVKEKSYVINTVELHDNFTKTRAPDKPDATFESAEQSLAIEEYLLALFRTEDPNDSKCLTYSSFKTLFLSASLDLSNDEMTVFVIYLEFINCFI